MDQELQMLISTLYGNKLNEKQLSNIIQMWNSNQNGYQDIMRKQAFAKMPAGTSIVNPVAAQRAINQTAGTTPKLGQNSYKFDKSQGRSANDMSAIANFKEAFRAARQGGHKTFFWKKTKANPSGMFSTDLASKQSVNTPQAQITTKLDMNKIDALMPKAPTFSPNYQFDVNTANAELRNQYKQNPHNNMSMRPYLKPGGNIVQQSNPIEIIIDALNNNPNIETINAMIQQSGQNPEMIIQEIVSRAQKGDQLAIAALSNLEKLMKNSTVAKLGTKLNYIKKIKGLCPEGEELVYMKEGGRVCPVCQKKAEKAQGGKKLEEKKKNAVSDFKEKRKTVNPNDTVNTKFGPRDLNGKTKYPKYNANKENYDFNTRMRVQEKDEKSGKKVIGSACGSKMKKKK